MYHITVGEKRPQTRKLGSVEPNTGFSIVKERGETLANRGNFGFPNGAKVWAARVIDGKMPKEGEPAITVTDPKYKGELKQLKWGVKGGSLIDVRYLKGYPTLDVLYQERVLNFKVDETTENSADIFMLIFPNGDNAIDENIDPLLVQHLKWHPYNRDSISRNPEFMPLSTFKEKHFDQEESDLGKVLDEKFEAGKIVRDAGTGGDVMAKCKNLFHIVSDVTDEQPEDSKLYDYLKLIADVRPSAFLKAVEDYKVRVSDVFEKIKSYEMADLTKDGTIVIGLPGKKKEHIVSDLPAKGEGIYDYLIENYTDPIVFDTTFKLIKLTDKLK